MLWRGGIVTVLSVLLCLGGLFAVAEEEPVLVDLELVIAADVSTSMDMEEKRLQHRGFVDAFASTELQNAIVQGELGRIAVTYVEWGGMERTRVVVPWMVIDSPTSARRFAQLLGEERPGRLVYGTNMGNAIVFGAQVIQENPFLGTRRVIDISGDGIANRGVPVALARKSALALGIIINGLPIVYRDPVAAVGHEDVTDIWDPEQLIGYFRDEVIGGEGSFLMPVTEREQFGTAIRAKLVREIAGEAGETKVYPTEFAGCGHVVQISSALSGAQ